jgi:hypothetical protein
MPYYHSTGYEYENVYDVETLESYIDYASGDIRRMKEAIKEVEAYQEKLREQIIKAEKIETFPEVELYRREDWHSKRIFYYVSVQHRPMKMINGKLEVLKHRGRPVQMRSSENEKFEGRERNAAIKRAEELSKIYQCEIKRIGFKKN